MIISPPNRNGPPLMRPFLSLAAFALFLWACQPTGSGKTAKTVSFTAQYETLSQYDSVVIIVEDAESGAADTVFKGKVDAISRIRNLAAPHYSGKAAEIVISGFNAGKLVYEVGKTFDGTSGATQAEETRIAPNTAVSAESATAQIKAGDTLELPKVIITPANLADKTLMWTSSDVTVLEIADAKIVAKAIGPADVTAALKSDPAKTAIIRFTVIAKDGPPIGTAPAAPVINSVNSGDAKAVLTWGPVADALEYNLYYAEGGTVDMSGTLVKNAVSPFEVKPLRNGAAYAFALTAVNAAGESGLSAIKTAVPQALTVSAPIIDSVSAGDGKAVIIWSALPEALGYVLYYKAGASVDKDGSKITSITSPYILSGLTNGVQYAMALSALKSNGETGLSNIATATPKAPAASGLSYPVNPAVYWRSVPIAPNAASVSGAVDSFTVAPALPSGLSLNKATGEITGIPTAAAAEFHYTVKAYGSGGTATAILTLTVNAPPSGLSYKENPAVCWQSVECPTNSASVTGVVDSFTVSPPLPMGLTLSKTTGAISGTPSVVALSAKYTVTAHNRSGAIATVLTLLVHGPPSGFFYASNPAVYPLGVAITPNTATISGAVDSFTVSPALPAGLSLNKTTGAITGTPTTASAAAFYDVTAWNAAGAATVKLNVTISNPISGLTYSANPVAYWKDVTLTIPNTASITGTPDSFTVAPALPPGLVLNRITGAITGKPTGAAAQADYIVTAKTGSATVTATLKITVNGPPAGLSYASHVSTYWKSLKITDEQPTVTGAVDSFTISPALPNGLAIAKLSGVISGTPTGPVANQVYTVTARNPAGAVTVGLSILIQGPPSLTYLSSSASYINGAPITANTVTATPTGTVDSFKVSPALPTGLVISKSSGAISGTPTAVKAAANYVVTAWNKAGTGTATLSIAVASGSTVVTIPAAKDISIDTGNTSGYDVGASGFGFFGRYPASPTAAFFSFASFDLSGATATGLVSAKIVFKTYAYMETNTVWNGTARNIKARVYSLNNPWVEGTGNWYYHDGAYKNQGELVYGSYGMTDAVKSKSTNPAVATGLLYTDHEIVRPANITERGAPQNLTISYGAANTHSPFWSPLPSAADLVDVELDVTEYVKLKAGTTTENGIMVLLEGLPADAWVGFLFKEIGDGSYAPKLVLTY